MQRPEVPTKEQIREARLAAGLSQSKAAELVCVGPEAPHGHREREMRYSSSPATAYQRLMRAGKPRELRGRLFDHICRWHNPDDVALFARMKPGARFADPDVQKAIREINPRHKLIKYSTGKFKDKLHKLDPGRPAWTLTAHLQKDCYKFIHYSHPRTITVREAARLQSFPDWFRFDGLSMVASFGLIGNAVPPLMAQAFAESFAESDAGLFVDKLVLICYACPRTETHVEQMLDSQEQSVMKRENMAEERQPSNPAVV